MARTVRFLYDRLLLMHGAQGWWPVRCEVAEQGYHPERFGIPSSHRGRFEVCMGAVLTQNTAWTQVEKALDNLSVAMVHDPQTLLGLENAALAEMIRPSGYCNQKASYLKSVASWFLQRESDALSPHLSLDELRRDLLLVRGVGPETADSILLYAFHRPAFVIDSYTRRICEALGLARERVSYEMLRGMFMNGLPADVRLFQEFHALLVCHAKKYYAGKDKAGRDCPLRPYFRNKKNDPE